MSELQEVRNIYNIFKSDADVYFGGLQSDITNYIEELEKANNELLEALKTIRDYDINDDKKETEIAENIVRLIKKYKSED